jgi:exodeoxyribonuclease-1
VKSKTTFFFYDLETSGIDPRAHRIMQFAGQRTDLDLQPIGDPVNILVTLTDEILPDPGAILVTGITPQKTLEEGYNEADFLRLLYDQVVTPGTIMTGFNSVRFDDEFMRYAMYRNFYDPYEWQWQNGRSRWDLLDVVRLTRALRPEGIEWPFDGDGNPTNRLELLTAKNQLKHEAAHDALSDVFALISVAKLIKKKQPKLFEYMFKMRSKQEVSNLVSLDDPQPFVYASGRYSRDFLHTTVALPIATGGKPGSLLVYDLRQDPDSWADKAVQELKDIRFAPFAKRREPGFVALPVKELACNRCPAVSPMGVVNDDVQKRLKIDLGEVQKNLSKLRTSGVAEKMREVFSTDNDRFAKSKDVDAQLYDGFVGEGDKIKMAAIRAADHNSIADFNPNFSDERLIKLLLRYKARNYTQSMSADEQAEWEEYRASRINNDLPNFTKELQRLSANVDDRQAFLLQELKLWAESVAPAFD